MWGGRARFKNQQFLFDDYNDGLYRNAAMRPTERVVFPTPELVPLIMIASGFMLEGVFVAMCCEDPTSDMGDTRDSANYIAPAHQRGLLEDKTKVAIKQAPA